MRKNKFTLIELLVVVAIIGILVSILLPSLQKARLEAKKVVCKNQLAQVGVATMNYMVEDQMIHPPIFRNGTKDAPGEGNLENLGKIGPGNGAMFTMPYLDIDRGEDVFFCPLSITEQEFNIAPQDNENTIWGTYDYVSAKAERTVDPFIRFRDGTNARNNNIRHSSDKSEGVIMYDRPVWSDKIDTEYLHYNALMIDGRVIEPAKNEHNMNVWLWGNTDGPR